MRLKRIWENRDRKKHVKKKIRAFKLYETNSNSVRSNWFLNGFTLGIGDHTSFQNCLVQFQGTTNVIAWSNS